MNNSEKKMIAGMLGFIIGGVLALAWNMGKLHGDVIVKHEELKDLLKKQDSQQKAA